MARGALGREGVEDGLLVRVGPETDEACEVVSLSAAARADGLSEALGVVGLEARVLPVLFERGLELPQDGRVVDVREPDVPLAAVAHRGVREVRRADDAGREARLTVKEPRLRVQARPPGVVAYLHFGAERLERVERLHLRRAHVGGREEAQARAAAVPVRECLERVAQLDEAGPLHERDEHIDAVRRRELTLNLRADAEVLRSIHEEVAAPRREGGAHQTIAPE